MSNRAVAVLVVEDEPLLRLTIVCDLEDAGFRVYDAANADEAIAVLGQTPQITVVFTDVDMPGSMDGLRLAAFVRDRWPPIKIIVTSGHRKPVDTDLPAGAPFLTKPYTTGKVVATIQSLVSA